MIEQAIYGSQDAGGFRFLARSPGFGDDWLAEAERLCTGFGERPAGVSCPEAVFARPFGPAHVAVVQVADQGADDAGRPGALAFRLLIVPRPLYEDLAGDPFRIADNFPPPWQSRGELPALEWTAGPARQRTVAEIRKVLDVPYSATLLGGAQALLDGGRIAFERTAPDPHLVRSLWALLPASARAALWPSTFAFSNAHHFHVVVVPRASGPEYDHYLNETQAGDYPEGRYELALQTAVEAGDQRELDALFARRSRSQVLRLGAFLLLALVLSQLLFVLLPWPHPPATPPPTAPAPAPLVLPPANECPTLSAAERTALGAALRDLGRDLGVKDLPEADTAEALTEDIARLDARLGTPDPQRVPGPLRDLGPLQRQLRALLYKHAVADYDKPGLNPAEMVGKLRARLVQTGALKERPGER